jgi:hypothetical protein
MTEVTNMELELDPFLRRMLKAYGNIPARAGESARRTRDRFLTEISAVLLEPTLPRSTVRRSSLAVAWHSNLARWRALATPALARGTVMRVLTIAVIVVMLFFSGTGVTAYAAASSLPGDALHPLKMMVENARIQLTLDPGSQARLYVDFAGKRLSEMQSLMEQGRYSDIAPAAEEFERDLLLALGAVEQLSQSDPARAAALNMEIAAILHNYSEILLQMLADVPADIQPVIQHALNTSDSVVGDEDDDEDEDGEVDDDDNGKSTPEPVVTATPSLTSTPVPNPGGGGGGGGDDEGGTGGGDDEEDDDDADDDEDDDDDDDDDD